MTKPGELYRPRPLKALSAVSYEERPCQWCDQLFKPKRYDQRTCSSKCSSRLLAREQYIREEGKPPDQERACGICGKPFPRVDRYDWRRKYCSETCQKEAHKQMRQRFYKRNPDARKQYRANETSGWSTTTTRFFVRYPDAPRACEVCGETLVVDLHHKRPRNGVPVRAANSQREDIWVLCPNHHAMIERGVATPSDLGLE